MSRNSEGHYSGDVTRCHCRVTVTGIVFRSHSCLQESPTVVRITNGLINSSLSLYAYRAEAVEISITIATHCNKQHLNYHCNTLQHTAPRLYELGSLNTWKMNSVRQFLLWLFLLIQLLSFWIFLNPHPSPSSWEGVTLPPLLPSLLPRPCCLCDIKGLLCKIEDR